MNLLNFSAQSDFIRSLLDWKNAQGIHLMIFEGQFNLQTKSF